ncbi:MFS transporter [Caldibacillus debilis]|uniref:MFS transporter n=1 Tax=Caldibacillus debilis TaxID=301148 RepID=UPI0023F29E58|nr:MFS transporter [Caldibacillus debilis]
MGERKKQWLLFIGLGTSTFGDFIYLVAINVFILRLTDSAAAVAGLWIMSPLAAILTQFWSGTFIDRFNKRRLLIATDLFRAVLTAAIPLLESVWLIYGILFLLAVAKAFFNPASITYITKLVPAEDRKKFNACRSLVTSGAFLIGPAISGMLLLISTPEAAILLNAVSFACSALVFSSCRTWTDQKRKNGRSISAFSRRTGERCSASAGTIRTSSPFTFLPSSL